jgi:predicted nucleic acid-binding protein
VKAVVDSTPLIALSLIDQLHLLSQLFDEVLVPPAVYEEVVTQGIDRPGATALANCPWIQVQAPRASAILEPMLLGLDAGETQVLLLAREVQPDWVLMDERLGRRIAHAMGLPLKGTVGLLLAAFRAGLITKSHALVAMRELVAKGIRISPTVIRWFEGELEIL